MQSVTFQLTASDLVDARLFAHTRSPVVRGIRVGLFAVAFGSAMFIVFLIFQKDWSALTTPMIWLAGALALLVWSVVGNRWLLPPAARKQLMRDKGLQGEIVFSWDDEHAILKSVHGESRWPWDHFYKRQESPDGFLLWQSDRIYFYLPKRSLSDQQAAEVRGVLMRTAQGAG